MRQHDTGMLEELRVNQFKTILSNNLLGVKQLNTEFEKAVETVRREAAHHRYLVKSIVAAYLDCNVDDVIIRVRKRTYPGITPEERKESQNE